MLVVLLCFLGFGLMMGGMIAFFDSAHQEGGIICFVSGAILLMLPVVLIVRQLAGILISLASYFFLVPSWRAYQTYRKCKDLAVFEPLNKAVTAAREKAFNRLCIFVILFILGAIAGLALSFHSLAV